MYYNRVLSSRLLQLAKKSRGRISIITGARQTGKSTLVKYSFPEIPLLNLDSPKNREVYQKMTAQDWLQQYPTVILDEVQKLPDLFHTIKACYDSDPNCRFILLGSSQVLLLKGVRETLAGRCAISELYPLSIPELCQNTDKASTVLEELLQSPKPSEILSLIPRDSILQSNYSKAKERWLYFLKWGGMPALLAEDFDDNDRFEWLQDYQQTYLQRDLADLAAVNHLESFVRAQKVCALRIGELLSYSELGRQADVTAPTAKKFLNYLELSYQVLLLKSWHRNPSKRLVKMPKLHFIDPGIHRSILAKTGEVSGHEFESAIVSEIFKRIKTHRLPIELFHLRSKDGREIDLLLEREDGYLAFEIKRSLRVNKTDARHFYQLEKLLDKPLLGSIIVSEDEELGFIDKAKNIFKMPAALLLS